MEARKCAIILLLFLNLAWFADCRRAEFRRALRKQRLSRQVRMLARQLEARQPNRASGKDASFDVEALDVLKNANRIRSAKKSGKRRRNKKADRLTPRSSAKRIASASEKILRSPSKLTGNKKTKPRKNGLPSKRKPRKETAKDTQHRRKQKQLDVAGTLSAGGKTVPETAGPRSLLSGGKIPNRRAPATALSGRIEINPATDAKQRQDFLELSVKQDERAAASNRKAKRTREPSGAQAGDRFVDVTVNDSLPWRHISKAHCRSCIWEHCADEKAMRKICPAGVIRDACGCCLECAPGLRWPCHLRGTQNRLVPLQCGLDLECVQQTDTPSTVDTQSPVYGQCECTQRTSVCSSDNRTFENICEFREVAIRFPGPSGLSIRHQGPCKTAPRIKTPPASARKGPGDVASFRCEIVGFPQPAISWHRARSGASLDAAKREEEALPGYYQNIITQNRGGPERYQLTSWLTVDGILLSDAGTYICRSSNDQGSVESRATLTVVDISK